MSKKIMLVIEDGEHGGFHFSIEGDIERLTTAPIPKDLSSAEFWATKLFQICQSVLLQAGCDQYLQAPDTNIFVKQPTQEVNNEQ